MDPEIGKGPFKIMLFPRSPVAGRTPPSSPVTAALLAGPGGGVGGSRIGPFPRLIKAGPSFGTSYYALELCCWCLPWSCAVATAARQTILARMKRTSLNA